MTSHVLVREIPDSFTRALSAEVPASPIDVALARSQHAAYRAAFAGCREIVVTADEACPDCVFVEDTAVILGGTALITRPGAPSRRAETPPIAAALAPHLELVAMAEPALLDGGDVMFVGGRFYAGRSARTNAAGIDALARTFGREVVAVALPPRVLHLKCVVSPLDAETVLLADDSLDPALFAGLRTVRVPAEETYAANAVAFGTRVIVAAEYRRTIDAVTAAGFTVVPVPTTEVRKADGSLTCQSLRW